MDSIIKIKDIVRGTSSNTEGFTLFTVLSQQIENGSIIKLSLEESTPMSSSFLNSSFGELVDKYGLEKIRSHIRLINYRPVQAERIRKYLNTLNSHH